MKPIPHETSWSDGRDHSEMRLAWIKARVPQSLNHKAGFSGTRSVSVADHRPLRLLWHSIRLEGARSFESGRSRLCKRDAANLSTPKNTILGYRRLRVLTGIPKSGSTRTSVGIPETISQYKWHFCVPVFSYSPHRVGPPLLTYRPNAIDQRWSCD